LLFLHLNGLQVLALEQSVEPMVPLAADEISADFCALRQAGEHSDVASLAILVVDNPVRDPHGPLGIAGPDQHVAPSESDVAHLRVCQL